VRREQIKPTMVMNTMPEEPLLKSDRILSVDVLRGLVMVIMALDHTRDYFSWLRFVPEDMSHTWGSLFFTRWITHFCAPLFFFLAGTGAYLAFSRGKSVNQISRFLLTRGLWLVILEYTVVGFGWAFSYPFGFGGTIWALGWSMVAMSLIVRLPIRWVGVFGVAMIALHNLADKITPEQFGRMSWLWTILHVPGLVWIVPGKFPLFIAYPLIPWIGVMAAGYAIGAIMKLPAQRRQRIILWVGVAASVLFIVVRAGHLYGNPPYNPSNETVYSNDTDGPWRIQPSITMSVVSFLNVEKYPPSLQYLLMTLGPGLILLSILDRRALSRGLGVIGRFFLVYGRVPMFFYVIHIYLVHAMAGLVAWLFHQPTAWLFHGANYMNPIPPGYGHNLPFIYLMWMTAILLLYYPCRWFAGVKTRHKNWWLSYL
jgi:uncharacterized membrane protein